MPVLIDEAMVFSRLSPRNPESHKGSYGKVLAVCGCPQYRGAAALSVLGALRTGSGIVTLACCEEVAQSVAGRILESTFIILPDDEALLCAASSASVCLAGCGLPENEDTAAMMHRLLGCANGVFVLDAGGLCSLARHPEEIGFPNGQLILTPHPGEMAKLMHTDIKNVLSHPQETVLAAAEKFGAVTLLKGHRTLIASPDGKLFENTTGNAGLARGGSGDILAGMIAGLAATGLDALSAAVCGVWLHGAAADRCASHRSQYGMLPEDILTDLCSILCEKNL